MSKGRKLLDQVTDAPDTSAAVRALSAKHWLKLYSHVLRNYDENKPSGQILAIMLFDGSRRYATGIRAKRETRKVMG